MLGWGADAAEMTAAVQQLMEWMLRLISAATECATFPAACAHFGNITHLKQMLGVLATCLHMV